MDRVDPGATLARVREAHDRRQATEADRRVPSDGWEPDLTGVDMGMARARRWSAVCPSKFLDATMDAVHRLHPPAGAAATAWAEHPRGRNLVVGGPVGVGKTYLALAAARLRHDAGEDVWFVPMVELLDALRPNGDPAALSAAMDVDVLVLDDLGAERPTDWSAERLYAIVNRRWLEERPTVVTTNLAARELRAEVGDRIYSRLMGDVVTIGLTGDDLRRRRP